MTRLLSDIKKIGEVGFPSLVWFSDHLPVGALFSIKKAI